MSIIDQQRTGRPYSPVKPKLSAFYPPRDSGVYLIDGLPTSQPEGNCTIFLNADTEYKSMPVHWTESAYMTGKIGRRFISAQFSLAGTNSPEYLFVQPEDLLSDRVDYKQVYPVTQGFLPIDYLRSIGYDATIKRSEDLAGLPVLEIVLFAHFALAELFMLVDDSFKADLLAKIVSKNIEMTRRLRCVTKTTSGELDSINLPWLVTVDGQDFAVKLCIYDTCAIHGISSYSDVAQATGIELQHKDKLTRNDKENMDVTAVEKWDDFLSYSLGDLQVYNILKANATQFETVYDSLGLSDWYSPPKMTIGSTVKNLFDSALFAHLGFSAAQRTEKRSKKAKKHIQTIRDLEKALMLPASAQYLRQNTQSTSALLAKVEGGRCRNNRPTDIRVVAPIVDLDIDGCYGEGQRNQEYFIGKPEVLSYPAESSFNEYKTLREFLKDYEGDLVPGAWFARISTSETLKHPQDYFASWFTDGGSGVDLMAKYVADSKSDTEKEETEFDEEEGRLKIFNYEIHNGTLTHDGLQWLLEIASEKQRAEMLDKVHIVAAMVYPASQRCKTFDELLEAYNGHKGRNTVKRVNGKLTSRDGECHAWYGVNIGDLIIAQLLINRKKYPKKTPLNTLYKLCVNTLYGDMTSKYFKSANVVVGNNITARARALAWYMEKGLNGFQTITDGCAFEVNRVVVPTSEKHRVNGTNVVNLSQLTTRQANQRFLDFQPLGGKQVSLEWVELTADGKTQAYPKLTFRDGQTLDPTVETYPDGSESVSVPAMSWVNQESMKHLQNLFPGVDVLHAGGSSIKVKRDGEDWKVSYIPRSSQFDFEAKAYYDEGRFHGSSNYLLLNPNGQNLKMRSYETSKYHDAVSLTEDDEVEILEGIFGSNDNPANRLMTQLSNPDSIERSCPFVKEGILKIGEYVQRQKTYDRLGLIPGDSYYKTGMLKEFSLSAFTFKTLEQYKTWEREFIRDKDKYGQSAEETFLTSDGRLSYAEMVDRIAKAVLEGKETLAAAKGARTRVRIEHPHLTSHRAIKTRLIRETAK